MSVTWSLHFPWGYQPLLISCTFLPCLDHLTNHPEHMLLKNVISFVILGDELGKVAVGRPWRAKNGTRNDTVWCGHWGNTWGFWCWRVTCSHSCHWPVDVQNKAWKGIMLKAVEVDGGQMHTFQWRWSWPEQKQWPGQHWKEYRHEPLEFQRDLEVEWTKSRRHQRWSKKVPSPWAIQWLYVEYCIVFVINILIRSH